MRNYHLLRQVSTKLEVHVLAFDRPTTRPQSVSADDCLKALSQFCASVSSVSLGRHNGEPHHYWGALRGAFSSSPYETFWLASRVMTQQLKRLASGKAFDVVHFDTIGLAQYRSVVPAIPAVLNFHDIDSTKFYRRAEAESNPLLRMYWRNQAKKFLELERIECPKMALNLVVSEAERQVLARSVSENKIVLVPNGSDTDYFQPRHDPGGHTLLFCGTMDLFPNQDAMEYFCARIWPRLAKMNKHLRMYVVGKNPPTKLVRLGLRDSRIHVTGFVDDVRYYFKMATLFICPVRTGGGTNLKLLDSLAMGVPVIASSFSVRGLGLEPEKHFLLADTEEDFCRQIRRALSNQALRMNLAMSGLEIVRRTFTWRGIGERLVNAYKLVAKPMA